MRVMSYHLNQTGNILATFISSNASLSSFSNLHHTCSFCPYRTKFASTLKRHILRHTGERPHKCSICGRSFIQKGFIQRNGKSKWNFAQDSSNTILYENEENSHLTHISTVQSSVYYVKPFKCSICGKEFTTKSSLKIHTTVHTGELIFTCKTCNKKFRYSIQLTRHKRLYKH